MPHRNVIRPIGPSIAYVPLTKGQCALIDAADAEAVGRFNWHSAWNSTSKHFYARRKFHIGEGDSRQFCFMHDFLCGQHDHTVDHVRSDDTLDNRRINLRPATPSGQMCNRKLSSLNTSGYRGVYWEPQKKLWRGIIVFNKKRISLGRHKDPVEIAKAYDRAARAYFGEFARPNFAEVA